VARPAVAVARAVVLRGARRLFAVPWVAGQGMAAAAALVVAAAFAATAAVAFAADIEIEIAEVRT